MIIGDKSNFAVEIEKTNQHGSYLYGKVCLWVKNSCVGYYNEEVLLKPFLVCLKNLSLRNNLFQFEGVYSFDVIKMTFDKLYKGNSLEYDKSLISPDFRTFSIGLLVV